ncbi:16S rRNA processing protein RimM [Halothece sp. PCC 7418]|uniref:ribosome maturation factor RimM n=1 Tax=Halothece sp. (strain PCC 7418) TaxID=65093 RepID=UPI0002A079BE|nr:ribosome maturation factor RimM [Halothece sp. PCC 7418]AFZ44860.1 16S rRNA processing protein RimM [Halothece sp. PCC 7418]
MMAKDDLIEIGTIVSAHGIKGEVKVYTDSDFPERFEKPGKRLLQRPNQTKLDWVTIKRGYYLPGKKLYVVRFEEITDRNQAEELKKSKLFVEKRDRPQLEENEYHVDDLIGLAVIDQETRGKIGQIVDIYPAGNDLLVVDLETEFLAQHFPDKSPEKSQVLIPFVTDIVPVVDLPEGELEVTLPPGLLAL